MKIDLKNKTIHAEGVSQIELYTYLKDKWRTDDELIKFEFPMMMVTSGVSDYQHKEQHGWTIDIIDIKEDIPLPLPPIEFIKESEMTI